MIKINDLSVLAVQVIENNEPMVSLIDKDNVFLWSQVENVKKKVDFGKRNGL